MLAQERNVAVDFDDVLVDFSFKYIAKFLDNQPIADWIVNNAKGSLKLLEILRSEPVRRELVRERSTYHVEELFDELYSMPREMIADAFVRFAANDETFYDDLPPTALCKNLLLTSENTEKIKRMVIVTKCGQDMEAPIILSKKRWIEKNIISVNPLIDILYVKSSENKGEALIAAGYKDLHLFVDDSLKNVYEVGSNTEINIANILIPSMGHNERILPIFSRYAELAGITISHYYDDVLHSYRNDVDFIC